MEISMQDSNIPILELQKKQNPGECLISFFKNLLNFAKNIENRLCKEKPELTKIFSQVSSVLRESLQTSELQNLPKLKSEIEHYVNSYIKMFKISQELQKVFTKLRDIKIFLKSNVIPEAKEFYDHLHSFFTCSSVDNSKISK